MTGSIDGAAGDIEEAASNFFDLCARGEHRGGFEGVRPRRVAGNVEPGEFALANLDVVGLVVDSVVKGNFAIAVTVDVAETEIFRAADFAGIWKRLIAAHNTIHVQVGNGNAAGIANLEGQLRAAPSPLFVRLQRVGC